MNRAAEEPRGLHYTRGGAAPHRCSASKTAVAARRHERRRAACRYAVTLRARRVDEESPPLIDFVGGVRCVRVADRR